MRAQQFFAGLCCGASLIKLLDLRLCVRFFKRVDQKIRFKQNLMVDAVNRLVHVMVCDEPANAVDVLLFKRKICKNFSCHGRTFHLLILSGRRMMDALRFVNANVMQHGGGFSKKLVGSSKFSASGINRA